MRLRSLCLLAVLIASRDKAPDPAALDPIARRYVVLALQLGANDPNCVDAYHGPDSLRAIARRESLTVTTIWKRAESLLVALGDSVPAYTDPVVRMRHRYLHGQLASMVARTLMVDGDRPGFDDEARALFDAEPPRDRRLPRAHRSAQDTAPCGAVRPRVRERDAVERMQPVQGRLSQCHPDEHGLADRDRSRDRPRLSRRISGTPRLQREPRAHAGEGAWPGRVLAVPAVQSVVVHRRGERQLRRRHGVPGAT